VRRRRPGRRGADRGVGEGPGGQSQPPLREFPGVIPGAVRRTLGVGRAARATRAWRKTRRRPIKLFLETIALTIGALLPIINPFSTAPLFVSLTTGFAAEQRKRQAFLGCLYAFIILVVFLLVGSAIIDFFGISVPGIRVAGGLIISTTGFRMLFPAAQAPPGELPPEDRPPDIAFTPIAMPSLAGPGSITVVLSSAAQIKSIRPHDWGLIYVAVVLGMAATLVFSFLVLRAATSMVRFLGRGGIDAMTRIFGFLLICIGMQFLLTGISDFFRIAHA
jgi:multiple antibiotic resistance protein